MLAIVQRVSRASVEVGGAVVARIDRGLLVLVGFAVGDTAAHVTWLADKVAHLRIFEDAAGKMNLGVLDLSPPGAILLVPNFTLAGDASKGRRPSFDTAMRPEQAQPMLDALADAVRALGVTVQTGVFRAEMKVELVNDGPITMALRRGT